MERNSHREALGRKPQIYHLFPTVDSPPESLYFSGIGIIQEIGIGLGFGVLVDTFISWPFFVPSVMLLLKKYNWWPSRIRDRN